jgi:glycine cleavage system protein P-like pyridoxal-binding family
MLIEPTETEPRREIDRFCDALLRARRGRQGRRRRAVQGRAVQRPLRRLDETAGGPQTPAAVD